MKKIIILFIPFFLTGCNPNHDFLKTCEKETNLSNYKENVKIDVSFDHDDNVTKVSLNKKYETSDKEIINSLKESTQSFNKSLKNVNIKENEEKNNYEVLYEINMTSVSDDELLSLDIKKNSIKYFNYLKKNGFECEKN